MSSKKALLSKLKKSLPKRPTVEIEQVSPQSISSRHFQFLKSLEPLDSIQDAIRIHISIYPEDQFFSKLLDLDKSVILSFINSQTIHSNIPLQLKRLIQTIDKKEDEDAFTILKQECMSIQSFEKLIEMNPFIFESLYFYPTENQVLIPQLLSFLFEQHNSSSFAELRHLTQLWMFQHRHTVLLDYLQNPSISSDDKQQFVLKSLHSQYESLQSQRLFIKIFTLIENNIVAFQRPLLGILLQNVPDKQNIPSLRRYFELLLDITINQIPSSKIKTYFSSAVKYRSFVENVLPTLPSNIERLIHQKCIDEFEQSFLYKNVYRVKWNDYLDILQKHLQNPLLSIDTLVYDYLTRQSQPSLNNILVYLQNPSIQLSQLRQLITRYINTQPRSSHSSLKKLLNMDLDTLKDVLENTATENYITILKNIPSFDSIISIPDKPITYLDMTQTQLLTLQKTRPMISEFDHVAIKGSKQNIIHYILKPDGESKDYYLPNEQFFLDLVNPNIPKKQIGKTFHIGKTSLEIANVTIHSQYLIQDEDTYIKIMTYLEQQQQLSTIQHPFMYFSYFEKTPILQHPSLFLSTFRRQIIQFCPNMTEFEELVYQQSDTLFVYIKVISFYIALTQSSFVKFFHTTNWNMSKLASLFFLEQDFILKIVYPELDHSNNIPLLLEILQQDVDLLIRRFMLIAYSIQYPTRRIPILPITTKSFLYTNIRIDYDAILSSTPEQQEYISSISPSPIISPSTPLLETLEDDEITNDPFQNFLQVALHTLTEL